jgi:hypothetical protein
LAAAISEKRGLVACPSSPTPSKTPVAQTDGLFERRPDGSGRSLLAPIVFCPLRSGERDALVLGIDRRYFFFSAGGLNSAQNAFSAAGKRKRDGVNCRCVTGSEHARALGMLAAPRPRWQRR